MGKNKLNPHLMMGDEIMVVSTEGIHDFGSPELYKPYVVVGIKYGHASISYNKPFYQIEPLGMTDEDRTGAMLAGGGRMKPMYIFSPEDGHGGSDQWILRPGFLRGELNEQTEPNLNPTLEVDDEILLVDIKKYGLADPPKLYTPYKVTRIQYPNKYQPSNAPTFYMVYPVDETQEEEEKRREEREREWDNGEHVVGDHNGDTWIFNPGFKRGELNEHENKQPGLSPELTYGDTILVVDVDREVESDTMRYNIPSPEMKPEIYTPYTVVDKEANGNQARWPWRYTLVPEDKLEEYEDMEDMEDEDYLGYEKLLYPWIYQWIHADTPTASGVDRLTISEHNQPVLSPDLDKGDIIRVIEIDGEHANMPDIWGVYKVHGISQDNATQELYYELSGETSEVVPDTTFSSTRLTNAKYLYHGDTWIPADAPMATKVDRKTISEHEQPKINPELEVDDIIRVIEVEDGFLGEKRPEIFDVYRVVGKGGDLGGFGVTKERRRYHLIKLQGEQRTWSQNRTYTIYNGDTWIYADVDRKTISEHEESNINPKLKVGDEIIVVEVGDVAPNKQTIPDKYVRYFVTKIYHGDEWHTYPYSQTYYGLNIPDVDVTDSDSTTPSLRNPLSTHKYLFPETDTWMFNPKGQTMRYEDAFSYDDEEKQKFTKKSRIFSELRPVEEGDYINEHKEEVNQRLTMGDIIRVVDVDKVSTYEQPTYDYDTGNASGNSLRTNHRREQVHGEDTYPRPMKLYMVTSKSTYRPKDRDYLNPYWMIWPVDKDGKIEDRKDLHQPILTEKDTWMTVKKHQSNIPGDMEKKQKEYDDSGRNITSRRLGEQDEPIDTQGGEIIRGDDEFSDEELEKRRTYDDFSDEEKREIDNEHIDMTPFTSMEVKILKTLHKHLTRSDLQKLSNETPSTYGEPGVKFWDIMKLFGINSSNEEKDTRNSKYAKWALDNWTKEGDYGNIEDPIKVPLKWYQIDREETGSQVEYKVGTTEVLGFDEDDASERGDYNFWDWGGEMETNDYGDYESYDSEITNSEFLRMDEGLTRVLRENTRVSDNFDDPLFLSMDKQKIQDLLFNYWIKHGPTLDSDKLKLLGFDMKSYDERAVVWDNLQEYYGDQELTEIIHERLEGLHDSWSYEYIVTSWSMEANSDIDVNVLVNGDSMMPISMESGEVIDMSLWDINKSSQEDMADYQYDDAYEEVRSTISDDISNVLLKDLPLDMNLDYLDMSEPGTFEVYVKENEVEMITEDDDGYIDDMVYIDEPREKHIRRMGRGLGSLVGFPLDKYKNMPPPENESDTTEDEIGYLEGIPVDKNLVDSADELRKHFTKFLTPKGLEYPKQEMKEVMQGVKAIILILKYYYNRPRPWQIAQAKGLELNSETLQSSSSPSYPSGHATQGRFVARYLSDLYPEYRNELMQIGDDIAFSRNMAKVHYPSDSAFGKMLGDDMYDFISNNTINESAPRPGSTSVEGFDDANLPYETKYMTLDEILRDIENIAYYEEVLEELEEGPDKPDGTYDWDTVNTVIRYADYWMENPESLTGPNFPPIQVIGSGMKDGSHRVSTLNALVNNIDTNNPYWRNVELEVRFYDPEIVMDSGHFYPWLYDIPEDKLQDAIDNKSVYNWENLKRWKEEQDFDFDMPPFEFDQDGNEDRIGVDINNKKGWRRLASGFNQNNALNKYLNKHTDNYKWSTVPQSELFSEENEKMYTNPYIMYVHLLQTSQGKNNVIKALKGMLYNEPDPVNQLQLEALLMIWEEEEEKFKKLYEKYEDIIEKNSTPDNKSNVFAAIKYAQDNFTDKKEIFKKFKLNGWSAYKFNLDKEGKINEQIITNKGDMLKSDIFRILSNTFILTPIDYSEIKDRDGNYYGIYDIKQEEYVNMSDLIEGVMDFITYGVESGDFKEEDIQKGITAITDWVSLMMNQKKEYVN